MHFLLQNHWYSWSSGHFFLVSILIFFPLIDNIFVPALLFFSTLVNVWTISNTLMPPQLVGKCGLLPSPHRQASFTIPGICPNTILNSEHILISRRQGPHYNLQEILRRLALTHSTVKEMFHPGRSACGPSHQETPLPNGLDRLPVNGTFTQ